MIPNRKQYKRQHLWAPIIRYTIDDNIFEVTTPYNEKYLTAMKDRIPSRYRTWEPDRVVWVYDKKYLPVMKWLLQNYYQGYVEEWPELSDLDRIVREMVRGAKTDAKKVWSASEIVL